MGGWGHPEAVPPGPGFHWFHPKPSQAVAPVCGVTVSCGTYCAVLSRTLLGFKEEKTALRSDAFSQELFGFRHLSKALNISSGLLVAESLHEIWLFTNIYQHYNPLSCCYPKVISKNLSTAWSKYTCICANCKFSRCCSWRAPRKKKKKCMYVYFNYTTIHLQKHNCGT